MLSAPSFPRLIGANPYAEQVQEDAAGHRRVLAAGIWQDEKILEPMRACRATSPADAHLAMASLAVAEISESFEHRVVRAYAVWTARRGVPVDLREATLKSIETAGSAGWRAFRAGVAQAMGERGLRLRRTGALVPVPQWNQVLSAPGPQGLPLGLSIGLSTRTPSTWRHLSPDRPKDWSPPSAAFGRSVVWPDGVLAWWPDNPAWVVPWRALAAERFPMLWVLPDARAEAALALPAGCLASRTEIRHAGALLAIVLRTTPGHKGPVERQSVSLLQWSGSPPQVDPNVLPVQADAYGRVPYRARSTATLPEAVAPLRLEAAMHAAFRDLAQQQPDIDAWTAQGLGIDRALLSSRLTCEQVDAVALSRARLEEGAALVLADDAGFGKGRMLAALVLIGLAQGRSVLVLTENPGLFSDFYRDLLDVSAGNAPLPEVLHQEARLLDPQGNLVVRGSATLPEPKGRGPALVLTTYGQLSNDPRKEKADWLRARLGNNAWCLLDEAHNAAGEAVVFEAVNAILDGAAGMVFASATFARTEQNLGLYRRALGLSTEGLARVRQALEGDDGLLRQVLVEEMARAGRLLRREHPTVPPPPVVWVEPTQDLIRGMAAFQEFWQGLFMACEAWEQAQGGRAQVAWLKLGGWLSRTVREFAMLAKIPALTDWIAARLAEDAKVVIAADLTMEAALKDGLGLKEGGGRRKKASATDDGVEEHLEGHGVYWRDRLRALLDVIVPAPSINPNPGSHMAMVLEGRNRANAALEQLPDWTLSPIDTLRDTLAARQVPSAELSGRQNVLVANPNNTFTGARRPKVDRQQQVRAFNAGDLDVAILTRAGSTGISLHAGAKFADQRKRWLMEWGIAADTVARVQFWGRVRRRDQVQEPGYASLALNTSYERRIRAREERKRLRLGSLTGHGRTFETEEVGPEGEALIAEWAADRPSAARHIGVHQPMEEVGQRVERALVRALILPEGEQAGLIARLDRGLVLANDAARLVRTDTIDRPSRLVRSHHWFGTHTGRGRLGGWHVELVERTYAPLPHATSAAVVEALRFHRTPEAGVVEGPEALARWRALWSREPAATAGDQRRAQLWPRIEKLLSGLTLGAGLVATQPETGQPALGLVLGITMPTAEPSLTGASALAPSQVGVRLFLAGMAEVITLPLSHLLADPALRLSGKVGQPHWFDITPFPWVATALEGDPLAAALLGRRLGLGRLVMIMDESGVERTVWRFPAAWTQHRLLTLPRDLTGAHQVRRFLKNFPDASVRLALPLSANGVMEPIDKGVMLETDDAGEDQFQAHWAMPQHRNLINQPLARTGADGRRLWRRFIAYKDLPRLLFAWENAGLGFRVDATYAGWVEKDTNG